MKTFFTAAESLLQATPMNSSAIMLTWTNPNEAPVLGYFVQYRNVMEGESLLGQQYTVSLAQSHRVSDSCFFSFAHILQ